MESMNVEVGGKRKETGHEILTKKFERTVPRPLKREKRQDPRFTLTAENETKQWQQRWTMNVEVGKRKETGHEILTKKMAAETEIGKDSPAH